MNSVSWFIYLAGLSESMGAVSCILALVSAVFCCGLLIYGGLMKECERLEDPRWIKGHALQCLSLKCTSIPIALLLVAAILPSKDTVYAIAVSEFGERVLHTETGTKAAQALNAWLDRQIEGEPK